MKKIYIIAAAVFALILAGAAFAITYRISSSSSVRAEIEAEIAALRESSKGLDAEIDELSGKITDIDTELSTKTTVNNYYMEYKKTHDTLTDEVAALREKSEELDKQIAEKQQELDNAAGLSKGERGKSYTLKKGETYSCPDKIPAGRYSVSGNGTFTVTNASGKVRLTQNLDVAFDNSYTFNLADKEKIKVTGDVTITEIK